MQESLLSVRSVPVSVHKCQLSDLKVRPPKVDEVRTVEASMRLDAVASAGFRMPRSKCANMATNGYAPLYLDCSNNTASNTD